MSNEFTPSNIAYQPIYAAFAAAKARMDAAPNPTYHITED